MRHRPQQLASAANATLASRALVRILDFNDYVNAVRRPRRPQRQHPGGARPASCAPRPASIIAAIVLGYEIFGRCKDLMERDSAWDGVTVSGLAAPAMAGRLMRLTPQRLAHAIALSGARAATSTAVRFGDISAAKSIANALVAQNGMQAALLAEHGITGPLDLFENPRGMREVFSKGDAAAALTAPLPAEATWPAMPFPAMASRASSPPGSDASAARRRTDNPQLQADDPDTPGCGGRTIPADRLTSREAADHSFNFLAASLIDGSSARPVRRFYERWNDPVVCALMAARDRSMPPEMRVPIASRFARRAQRTAASTWSRYLRPASHAPL
jgi:2-methylcitrate dehydratase